MKNMKSQNGNVLFIILIAVALFAALSYAVSSGMRGGENTITSQQAKVGAGEILRSMSSIREGYAYLMNQGCSIDEISLIKSGKEVGSRDFDAALPRSDESCDVFHPLGAGISYPLGLEQFQINPNTNEVGKLFFRFSGNTPLPVISNLGTTQGEHVAHLTSVTQEICQSVNKEMGYSNPEEDKVDTGYDIGDEITEFSGRTAGCRSMTASGPYQIWFVLLEL